MLRPGTSSFALCAIVLVVSTPSVRAQSTTRNAPPPAAVVSSDPVKTTAAESTLAKAERFYRTGNLVEAEQEYKAALQAEPGTALAHVGLVRVYLKQKMPTEAYAAAARAAELAPTLDAVRVALGEVYFRQGKLADAENEFTALVKANTREARAYLGLSRVYRAASYFKHAKLAIDRAHVLDAGDPDIHQSWIGTLSLPERLKALQAYLARETNDDAEERRRLEQQLAFFEHQATQAMHPCALTTKPTQLEIKLDRLFHDPAHIRAFGLGVKVNGSSSMLVLDTGASGIIMGAKVAEKAGIKRVVQADLRGVGDSGAASGYVGYADTIKIGNLEFRDCYVRVIDKGSIMGDDGLIGADVFSDFLIDLDFPRAKIKLSQLPPRPDDAAALQSRSAGAPTFQNRYVAPEMKSFTPVFRFGHQLLIATRLNNLPPKLFLIDTGGFNNTISPDAAREVTKVSSDSNTKVKGLSGSVKNVFRADELVLQFGNLRQKNLDMVAFETKSISDAIGTEVSGILGFAMLLRLEIKIDYRDGLVDLIYPN